MIERPAFVQIDLVNGTKISARYVRYSDPMDAHPGGAFLAEDAEGTKTYVLWMGIARLTVFPLDEAGREATPLEKA